MRVKTAFIILCAFLWSCNAEVKQNIQHSDIPSIAGTWQLLNGTLIEKGDTTVTDYTKNVSFIKIINDSHFAFLQHDLTKGKDSPAVFVAGGGKYSLSDSTYTEHLEYCSAREWEGNDFPFTIKIENDTLTQYGIEKVEEAGVNRINIEKYVRVKK
jgi:hypothetical protein